MLLFWLPLVACVSSRSIDTAIDTDTGESTRAPDPFADFLVSFEPGEGAGFGQELLPWVVMGPPQGAGPDAGSADVVSLGREGTITLGFNDIEAIDGEGPDLLVFENPFPGWLETGIVSASEDGETWFAWSCSDGEDRAGCAGLQPVLAHPDNNVSPLDPGTAGGDAFDLADLGLARARYIRIQDTGSNDYAAPAGGFDLDAVAIVNGAPIEAD
jgi:hypothetical protein